MINEVALRSEFWNHTGGEHHGFSRNDFPVTRIRMLCDSLQLCQEYIRTFLVFSSHDLPYLTVFIYPKLSYVFMTLSKLVFLDSDNCPPKASGHLELQNIQNSPWDPVRVGAEADFLTLATEVSEKFAAGASNYGDFDGQRSAMANLGSAMKILMLRYEQQMGQFRKGFLNTEQLAFSKEISQDNAAEAANEIGTMSNNTNMDMALPWDLLASLRWEETLELLV
jgi:hypothetical protein